MIRLTTRNPLESLESFLWVNPEFIVSLQWIEAYALTKVKLSDEVVYVTETPEQIAQKYDTN